jgi:hypothetical protein
MISVCVHFSERGKGIESFSVTSQAPTRRPLLLQLAHAQLVFWQQQACVCSVFRHTFHSHTHILSLCLSVPLTASIECFLRVSSSSSSSSSSSAHTNVALQLLLRSYTFSVFSLSFHIPLVDSVQRAAVLFHAALRTHNMNGTAHTVSNLCYVLVLCSCCHCCCVVASVLYTSSLPYEAVLAAQFISLQTC